MGASHAFFRTLYIVRVIGAIGAGHDAASKSVDRQAFEPFYDVSAV